jgi:hypothetical protein
VINVDLPTPDPKSNRNEDEYLDCEVYKNHDETPAEGFCTFKVEDEYYFVMFDNAGKVLPRSEGTPPREREVMDSHRFRKIVE